MKLLLTGGTGFFGRALLRHHLLLAELDPIEIAVLSRNPEQFLAAYPEFNSHSSITFLRGRHSAARHAPVGPNIHPCVARRNILDLAVAYNLVLMSLFLDDYNCFSFFLL
jgi:hypothetical protein